MNTKLKPTLCVALVAVLVAGAATATDYNVNQTDFAFNPAALVIQVGDTVHWLWSSNSHTVTNGTGPGDPDAGTIFDAPLDAGNPSFSYTFTTAGNYPYFCRPHVTLGMTGTITVESSVPVESGSWADIKALFR